MCLHSHLSCVSVSGGDLDTDEWFEWLIGAWLRHLCGDKGLSAARKPIDRLLMKLERGREWETEGGGNKRCRCVRESERENQLSKNCPWSAANHSWVLFYMIYQCLLHSPTVSKSWGLLYDLKPQNRMSRHLHSTFIDGKGLLLLFENSEQFEQHHLYGFCLACKTRKILL